MDPSALLRPRPAVSQARATLVSDLSSARKKHIRCLSSVRFIHAPSATPTAVFATTSGSKGPRHSKSEISWSREPSATRSQRDESHESSRSPVRSGSVGALSYNHMVVDMTAPETADRLFHALADATRRDILLRCLEGEHSVSTLASFYPMSFAAVQKHVAVLERAQLVTKRRRGREQLVRGDVVVAIEQTLAVLEQFETMWRSRLNRMSQILKETTKQGGAP
jgi:DNA-binding transcriptional ArsR family regulator